MMAKDLIKKPEAQSTSAEEATPAAESTNSSIVDSSETAEFVDKLPSEAGEKASEDKSQSSGGNATAQDDDSAAAIAGSIKEIQFPSRRVMKQEVRNALVKKEVALMNKAKEHGRHGNYFELNNVLAKIREIRFTLSELVRDTYESIKNLWLKYVYKSQ